MASDDCMIPIVQFVRGHNPRLDEVEEFYLTRTGHRPEYIIQTPGRVNIIGDHIDYHGFSVIPMAIEYSIFMACGRSHKPNAEKIQLFNVQSSNFPDWSGSVNTDYEKRLRQDLGWHSFFLCGYIGCLENQLAGDKILLDNDINMTVAVYSDLPTAAGLSSSSSLVCASALAAKILHDSYEYHDNTDNNPCKTLKLNRRDIAKDCATYERLIGTQGGGMDQAVIMTADEGYAKHVEFMPELNCTNVKLPDGLSFLISHCGAEYFKAATSGFNARVLETKLAAALIARHAEVPNNLLRLDSSITFHRLKECLGMTLEQLLNYINEEVFKEKGVFTIGQIQNMLQINSVDQLINKFNTSKHIVEEIGDALKLKSRSVHVIEEALRVERFKVICESTMDYKTLGDLMTESHYSLRDLYECSHPNLDCIVETALRVGALGSRLTGAGWAGCAITLVEDHNCPKVMDELVKVSRFTIRTEPQAGCKIFQVVP